MSKQTNPKYPDMISGMNPIIKDRLIDKYEHNHVVWPIVLLQDDVIIGYLYEKSKYCNVNNQMDNRPDSSNKYVNYYIDYTKENREIVPNNNDLLDLISPSIDCSYVLVVKPDNNLNTVDLDYVWYSPINGWRAIELTTFYMPLKNQQEAERLVLMLNRRPSWKGENGAHAIYKLIEAANDLNLAYWMVIVNSENGVSNNLVLDGNVYRFPLTKENINNIRNNVLPNNAQFESFNDFLNWL